MANEKWAKGNYDLSKRGSLSKKIFRAMNVWLGQWMTWEWKGKAKGVQREFNGGTTSIRTGGTDKKTQKEPRSDWKWKMTTHDPAKEEMTKSYMGKEWKWPRCNAQLDKGSKDKCWRTIKTTKAESTSPYLDASIPRVFSTSWILLEVQPVPLTPEERHILVRSVLYTADERNRIKASIGDRDMKDKLRTIIRLRSLHTPQA